MARFTCLVVLFACFVQAALAQYLYSAQPTRILRAHVSNPLAFTIVGNHGLTAPYAITSMTYHPTAGLLALQYQETADPNNPEQFLVRFDANTGAGSLVASLGRVLTDPQYEGLEYHPTLGLVASREVQVGSSLSTEIVQLSLTGAATHLSFTGSDNDWLMYHGGIAKLYEITFGANNINELDPLTGAKIIRGPNIAQGDGAYDSDNGNLYVLPNNNSRLYRLTPDALGNISFTDLGPRTGPFLAAPWSLAYVPVPEPATMVIFGLGIAALLRKRKR